ncbi:MAG: CDP-diacylglycerol--serine O-phosphatidyltransferase [Planctomycetota bacterium]
MNDKQPSTGDAAGPERRRSIGRVGVLPSLVTLGNLICGFAAIGLATVAQIRPVKMATLLKDVDPFTIAGVLIFSAMIFDALDGKIARMANLTSEFGAQLDSLCDIVSFGVAPAYLVFLEAVSKDLFQHSRYAWVCAVLYIICAALRLARFNVETEPDEESHRYFRGLPTPAAAGVIAGLALLDASGQVPGHWAAKVMPFVTIVMSGLMVSRVKYIHLVNALFRHKKPFTYLVLLVFLMLVVLAFAKYTEAILLAGFAGYMLSGPAALAWSVLTRRAQKHDARS